MTLAIRGMAGVVFHALNRARREDEARETFDLARRADPAPEMLESFKSGARSLMDEDA
jgi:hypothetical protein